MEIAVIGNSEFILGFRLAGIRKTYAAENDEKLNECIASVLRTARSGSWSSTAAIWKGSRAGSAPRWIIP